MNNFSSKKSEGRNEIQGSVEVINVSFQPEDNPDKNTQFQLEGCANGEEGDEDKEKETSFSPSPDIRVAIERHIFNQGEFDEQYGEQPRPTMTWSETWKDVKNSCQCSGRCLTQGVLGVLPFIATIKDYNLKTDFLPDLIAGLTIGIMQIPQGMAYAQLANLDPVYGLYVSFFPVVLYFFFGTSRHVSVGTFAVVSLMVGSAVDRFNCEETAGGGGGGAMTTLGSIIDNSTENYTTGPVSTTQDPAVTESIRECKIGVATAVTFLGGSIQLLAGILQLGFIVRYLSEALTRGFTTGCAIHVFTSQLKHVFGVEVPTYSGPWVLIYTYRDLFLALPDTNPAAVIMSALCIIVLWCTKEYLNPPVRKRIKIPIPIDLIVVILATIWSSFGELEEKYGLSVVGNIPTGIPPPEFPPADLFSQLIGDAVAIAVVAYAISISMAQGFAKKHNYEIRANQELVAHGLCNVISCNFNCYMMCVSLSRSVVQEEIGVRSQVSALYNSGLILVVLLWLAYLFEALPSSTLAAIIIVALKGMFMQFTDIPKYYRISLTDLSVWLVTFIAVCLFDVAIGLGVGVAYNLLTIVGRTQSGYTAVEGQIDSSECYKDVGTYCKVHEVDGVKIIRYDQSLYYANVEHFLDQIYHKSGCNAKKIRMARAKKEKRDRKDSKKAGVQTTQLSSINTVSTTSISSMMTNGSTMYQTTDRIYVRKDGTTLPLDPNIHHLILDCSGMTFLDDMGVQALKTVVSEYKFIGVDVYLAAVKGGVREMLVKGGFYEKNKKHILFPSVHDAVLAAQAIGDTIELRA